ncbi:MAG: RDD family protein [Nitrososphaerales archaeon]
MVPDPPRSEQGLPAGFVSRLVAMTIDLVILVTIATIVTAVASFLGNAFAVRELTRTLLALFAAGFALVLNLGYFVGLTVAGGQTIGKRIMGLRIVRTDGSRVKFWPSCKRYLGYILSIPLFWGYLMVLIDPRRQAFQDKLADTFVIYFMPAEGELGPLEIHFRAIVIRRRARLARERAAQLSQPSQPANPNS